MKCYMQRKDFSFDVLEEASICKQMGFISKFCVVSAILEVSFWVKGDARPFYTHVDQNVNIFWTTFFIEKKTLTKTVVKR